MPLRVTNFEDDTRGNEHILRVWAIKLKEFFPQITQITRDTSSFRRLVVEIAPTHKDRFSDDEVIRRTIEIHTESAYNYTHYFIPRRRIAIQHYEREGDRVFGDSCIYRTTADLFFHGFRNRDPADEADDILFPLFFWTKTLKSYMDMLSIQNNDEPKKPIYVLPHQIESRRRYYDGFRVGTWRILTPQELQTGKYKGDDGRFMDIDWNHSLKTKEGKIKVFYTTIGVLMPVKDILEFTTKEPFMPGLENFVQ